MKYLSNYIEDKQTALFDEIGAFFAFGDKQLMERKKEGIQYISMGSGMICPKDKADYLMERLEQIHKEGIAQDIAENGKEGIIKRELANHECYYTGSVEDAQRAVKQYGYTKEEVLKIYFEELKKGTYNDW